MPMRSAWMHIALALLLGCQAIAACADVFRPAYLELRETGSGRYDVLWRVPAQGGNMRLAAYVQFPAGTETLTEPSGVFSGDTHSQRWQIRRDGGLVGETVRVDGIAAALTDVIVRVERQDGSSQTARLAPEHPGFVVEAAAGAAAVSWSYLSLGVGHILGGVDHLLFVLSLLLVVRGSARIVATITAFTVAHSFTLAAATLGVVRVPGPPVEAIIALSIVFVATEIVHGMRGRTGLTARAPWLVAFIFGLLHGFGFAGALSEIGLPQSQVPLALLAFNVGVEAGQLMFVAVVVALIALLRRVKMPAPRWAPLVAPYGIGAIAMFWVIERAAAF